MDIAALKKKLETFVFRPMEGDSWEFVWERQRELKPNRSMFWRILIRVLRKFLLKVYSFKRAVSEKFAIILSFSSSGIIEDGWAIFSQTPSRIEPSGNEGDRSLPKGFVPLPDAEIGGCARNDSLIAPVI
ncbi:hypothetical protein QUB10_21225 [Microcoleus sp. B5-D4]|uniref:hypothetical protein n=1 Tax=unclassified Microcoleus TaxID=2642155 RepID=UPI002FCF4B66